MLAAGDESLLELVAEKVDDVTFGTSELEVECLEVDEVRLEEIKLVVRVDEVVVSDTVSIAPEGIGATE